MKFLCIPCNEPMRLQKSGDGGAGSLSLRFHCAACDHEVAMLTNAGETQLVQSLGVRMGRSKGAVPAAPMSQLRAHLAGSQLAAPVEETAPEPVWSEAAEARLAQHPRFVQPVIRQSYSDYARREGLGEVTLDVMAAARRALESK